MIRRASLLVLVVVSASFVRGQPRGVVDPPPQPVRFGYVDVTLDSGTSALAAYQLEFSAEGGRATVVGIEGGDPAAFRNPPYYDAAALGQNRVILAAFSTGEDLPKGKSRVARIHLMIEGAPGYAVKLVAAADAAGRWIGGAALNVTEGSRP